MRVVKVYKEKYNIWGTSVQDDLEEMRNWCRATFGKGRGPDGWVWKAAVRVDHILDAGCYIKFYFTHEEHATLFIIRWGV